MTLIRTVGEAHYKIPIVLQISWEKEGITFKLFLNYRLGRKISKHLILDIEQTLYNFYIGLGNGIKIRSYTDEFSIE